MATIKVRCPKRVYGHFMVVGGQSKTFYLGITPEGDYYPPYTIKSGSVMDESPGIAGENNVSHVHISGDAECYYHRDLYTTYLDGHVNSNISPCLKYMEGWVQDGANDFTIGTHLAPPNGSAVVANPFGNGGFWGIYRDGFIIQVISPGKRAVYWTTQSGIQYDYRVLYDTRYGSDQKWSEAQLWVLPSNFSAASPCTNSGLESFRYRNLGNYATEKPRSSDLFGDFAGSAIPEHPQSVKIEDDLIKGCVDDMKFIDINSAMFLKEAMEIKKLLPPLKDIKGLLKLSPKAWANTYLWYRYGVKLTISDIRDIIKGVKRAAAVVKQEKYARSRRRFSFSNVTIGKYTYSGYSACKLTLNRKPGGTQGSLWDLLSAWDLEPSFQHVWDFIPYSFVADWLLPLGDYLEHLDTDNRMASLPIRAVTRSWKFSRKFEAPSNTVCLVSGNLELHHYQRVVTSSPRLPVFSWQPSSGGAQRIFDAGALVLQKSKF